MARKAEKYNAPINEGNANYRSPMQRHDLLKAMAIDTRLSDRGVRAAIGLLDHRNNKTGQLDPTIQTLATELGWSRSKTERAIDDLKQCGYVTIKHRFYASGSQKSSQYDFDFEMLDRTSPQQIGQREYVDSDVGGTLELKPPCTSNLTHKPGGEIEPDEKNPDNSHDETSGELAGGHSDTGGNLTDRNWNAKRMLAYLESFWPPSSKEAEHHSAPGWQTGALVRLHQLRKAGHSVGRIEQVCREKLSYSGFGQWPPGLGTFLAGDIWEMLDPQSDMYVPSAGANDNQQDIAVKRAVGSDFHCDDEPPF